MDATDPTLSITYSIYFDEKNGMDDKGKKGRLCPPAHSPTHGEGSKGVYTHPPIQPPAGRDSSSLGLSRSKGRVIMRRHAHSVVCYISFAVNQKNGGNINIDVCAELTVLKQSRLIGQRAESKISFDSSKSKVNNLVWLVKELSHNLVWLVKELSHNLVWLVKEPNELSRLIGQRAKWTILFDWSNSKVNNLNWSKRGEQSRLIV